jgi:hypothetical protein
LRNARTCSQLSPLKWKTVVQSIQEASSVSFFKFFLPITMSSQFSTPNWLKEQTRQGRALNEAARLVVTSSFDPSEGVPGLSPEQPAGHLPFRERTEEQPADITLTQSNFQQTDWMSSNPKRSSRVHFGTPWYQTSSPPLTYNPSQSQYGMLNMDIDLEDDDQVPYSAPTGTTGTPPVALFEHPAVNPVDLATLPASSLSPLATANEMDEEEDIESIEENQDDGCTIEELFGLIKMLRTELNDLRSKTGESNNVILRRLYKVDTRLNNIISNAATALYKPVELLLESSYASLVRSFTPQVLYSFLFCGFSVKFTIQIPSSLFRVEISSLFRVEVLPMLMLRTSAKRPQCRFGIFARFLTLCSKASDSQISLMQQPH